jgi:hypothetical protein
MVEGDDGPVAELAIECYLPRDTEIEGFLKQGRLEAWLLGKLRYRPRIVNKESRCLELSFDTFALIRSSYA